MSSAKEVMENQKRDQLRLGLLLSSPEGKFLLEELAKEFDPDDIMGATPELTAFNVGARHVYRVLKNLRDEAQKE